MEWTFLIISGICVIGGVVIWGIWEITKSKKKLKMLEESNKQKLEEYLKKMNDQSGILRKEDSSITIPFYLA